MLRGNVDTRLRKLSEGVFDAVVLAEAGVRRLGLTVAATRLEGLMVPAVAQGALALEARADDPVTAGYLAALHNRRAAVETAAERAVMRALGGSCTVPMGALARWDEATGDLSLEGYFAREDGGAAARRSLAGKARDPDAAAALGTALAAALREALARA
jgi:hydroxymethylbilane synthase